MHRNLFDCVNIDPAKTNLPDGTNPDAADACAKYNAIIHSVGGINLQLLGLGLNGHIGFNEPGEAFELETHCEDLTQETFLSAYLHRDAIPPGYERQWLCRVATNKAKDYLQSAYQRHTLLPGEDNIPPGLSPPAEETVLRRSAAAEIRDLILHMRQPYQPVCRLCLLEEKTPEEAALALGRPGKTIHTQLSRGKRMLREALERSGNDDMLSP